MSRQQGYFANNQHQINLIAKLNYSLCYSQLITITHSVQSINNRNMKSRYSRSHSKDKFREYSKDLTTNENSVNIQIFNITSRHRNKMLSKTKRDSSKNYDEFMNLTKDNMSKRGSSVFQRRSKEKHINTSSHGPVMLDYNIIKKKDIKDSSSKLKACNISMALTSQATPIFNKRDFIDQDINAQDIHYEMVRFQQKCKKLVTK